jgi:hypothetical protein
MAHEAKVWRKVWKVTSSSQLGRFHGVLEGGTDAARLEDAAGGLWPEADEGAVGMSREHCSSGYDPELAPQTELVDLVSALESLDHIRAVLRHRPRSPGSSLFVTSERRKPSPLNYRTRALGNGFHGESPLSAGV